MSKADSLAVLTGTSSGIGAAIAKALLREGWTILGLSRRPVDFDHPRYRHIRADLADLQRLTDLADRELAPVLTNRSWRRIGLVNNAASIGSLRSLEETDPRSLMNVFAVNTVAPIFLMAFFVRTAPASAALRIVNVSTGAAVTPIPGAGDYGSSKAALRLAGMTLAAELSSDERPGGARSNVAILSYSPGVVDTPMQETARSAGRPWNRLFVDFHSRGLLQPPEAPALEVVRFLTCDAPPPFEERRFGAA